MSGDLRVLSEVAVVDSGAGFPIDKQGSKEGEYPFLKVSDMNLPGNERIISVWNNAVTDSVRRELRAKAFPAGSIIFPKIGAAIATNKKRVLTRPSCVDNNVMAITPMIGRLESDYLYYLLIQKNLSEFASTSNPPSIKKTEVERWRIRVPSLNQQRRIVDVLSRAEGIVRLRREARAKAAEFVPAMFLDMFGDPASNPKGWPFFTIGDLVERFEGGKNLQAGDVDTAKFQILKISAVTSGRYIEEEAKPAPLGLVPPSSHFVRVGDLLFSRANTEALVGAVALVEKTNGVTLLPDKLWRFVWRDYRRVHPRFALHLFQQATVRAMLSSIASGTGGSMKNISQAKLRQLRLPLPPIDLQRNFAAKAESVGAIVAQQDEAWEKATAIFNSLLQRAFAA